MRAYRTSYNKIFLKNLFPREEFLSTLILLLQIPPMWICKCFGKNFLSLHTQSSKVVLTLSSLITRSKNLFSCQTTKHYLMQLCTVWYTGSTHTDNLNPHSLPSRGKKKIILFSYLPIHALLNTWFFKPFLLASIIIEPSKYTLSRSVYLYSTISFNDFNYLAHKNGSSCKTWLFQTN